MVALDSAIAHLVAPPDHERRSRMTPPYSRSSSASSLWRRRWVTQIDHFSFRSANGSRRDACPAAESADAGKHRLYCNLGKRGGEFIAHLAPASDESHYFGRRRSPSLLLRHGRTTVD